MNNTVQIPVSDAGRAFDIVLDLKDMGLIANKDFPWSYKPRQEITIEYDYELNTYDHQFNDFNTSNMVEFTFVEESMASYIRLKYND